MRKVDTSVAERAEQQQNVQSEHRLSLTCRVAAERAEWTQSVAERAKWQQNAAEHAGRQQSVQIDYRLAAEWLRP
jgi:hypothetical protein